MKYKYLFSSCLMSNSVSLTMTASISSSSVNFDLREIVDYIITFADKARDREMRKREILIFAKSLILGHSGGIRALWWYQNIGDTRRFWRKQGTLVILLHLSDIRALLWYQGILMISEHSSDIRILWWYQGTLVISGHSSDILALVFYWYHRTLVVTEHCWY